ncbi:hypothetical protein F5Y15DRAFT_233685 [Xylariaceae sp. FL0016]|nr:hypothetical protein F5Y15DRAFT_233685 [Xylariaceae sp. FL0016]
MSYTMPFTQAEKEHFDVLLDLMKIGIKCITKVWKLTYSRRFSSRDAFLLHKLVHLSIQHAEQRLFAYLVFVTYTSTQSLGSHSRAEALPLGIPANHARQAMRYPLPYLFYAKLKAIAPSTKPYGVLAFAAGRYDDELVDHYYEADDNFLLAYNMAAKSAMRDFRRLQLGLTDGRKRLEPLPHQEGYLTHGKYQYELTALQKWNQDQITWMTAWKWSQDSDRNHANAQLSGFGLEGDNDGPLIYLKNYINFNESPLAIGQGNKFVTPLYVFAIQAVLVWYRARRDYVTYWKRRDGTF